jgi:hypothetical protein
MKTKTYLLLFSLFVTGSHALLAEVDTGRPVSGTPYDKYLGPFRAVHAKSGSDSPTIDEVRAQIRTGRRFRYFYDPAQPYIPQAPEVTEARQQGDCKAKSVWLASKMLDRSVRYVVGKAKPGDKMSHAWLLWSNGGEWLFLDPTFEYDVLSADRVTGRKLIVQYSWRGSSAYTHPSYSEYVK